MGVMVTGCRRPHAGGRQVTQGSAPRGPLPVSLTVSLSPLPVPLTRVTGAEKTV